MVNEDDFPKREISMEELMQQIPEYRKRRLALTRDPLGSVEELRVVLYLVARYLFGMRVRA